MKATELRLGNLIKIGGNTIDTYQTYKSTKVTLAILNEIAGENDERPDAELSVFMPIPLTEEWLLKFHLNEDIEKSTRFPNEITIYDRFLFIWKENYKYWYVMTSNHKEFLTKIEFVHEYQNFIFALTGNELTYEP
ncbi:MAG: hypothetical protein UR43_C0019G0007 [candidate division TM6 bacterium GW2011_GWF2_33_332]|nr:MAG: hypothetical protein UR43_C0019G0007 [candidate division TM6 bacterium GW2011_GWF2_33_332]